MASTKELRDFRRQAKQIERAQKQDRLLASRQRRTLELRNLQRAVRSGTGLTLREYGKMVTYSATDLKKMQSRAAAVERSFKSTGKGIKAILARTRPAPTFSRTSDKVSDDVTRARNIPKPAFVSQQGKILNFRVRGESGRTNHQTRVELVQLEEALRTKLDERGSYAPAVAKALSGDIRVDCSCGRYLYWFRYMCTVADIAIVPERAFPKIRNFRTRGIICKHLIRVLSHIQTSRVFQKTLADRFEALAGSVMPTSRERFATQAEQAKERRARGDTQLRRLERAKDDYKKERRARKREEERLTKIATRAERKKARDARRERRRGEDERREREFQQMQRDKQALKDQLAKEKKKAADLAKKAKQQEEDQGREIAIQVVRALRQAGLPDSQIKNNPAVKKAKLKLEEVK